NTNADPNTDADPSADTETSGSNSLLQLVNLQVHKFHMFSPRFRSVLENPTSWNHSSDSTVVPCPVKTGRLTLAPGHPGHGLVIKRVRVCQPHLHRLFLVRSS